MNQRGLTLAEVMISSAIFLGMSILVVAIMRVGRTSEVKGEAHSDAQRAALVAIEKIRAEVDGAIVNTATITTDTEPAKLEYLYVPRLGEVTIDFTGHPRYSGPATLTMAGQNLVRLEDTDAGTPGLESQPLMDLGAQGRVDFRKTSNWTLEVTLKATRSDATNPGKLVEYEHMVKLYLYNQP